MNFLLRRLGFYVLAYWAALTIDFVLPRLLPGDPAATIMGSLGSRLQPGQVEAMQKALGLDHTDGLPQQYVTFLSHAARGDLGFSYSYFPATVTEVIGTGLIWTLLLGLTALLISFVLGNLLGVFGAWRRVGFLANVVPPIMILAGAFPPFFLALSAVYVLGVQFNLIPTSHAFADTLAPAPTLEFAASVLEHLFLPAVIIVIVTIGIWTLTMRNTMVSVLADDFITMAEAKGLRQHRIMFNYAARNALLPSVTGFGVFLGFVLSGQVLIEQVFAYPGLGFLLVGAVGSRDYPLMQGLFLMITTAVLAANFLVDVLYTRLDPRVRAG